MKFTAQDPLYSIHELNIDIKSNEIYLFGEDAYLNEEQAEPGVEYIQANRFIKNLNILSKHSNDPILIHMKTCGGYWEEGLAIADTIRSCNNHVTILNYTHARSMSSIIFLSADKRVMMPSSTFMFHQGTLATSGTYKQVVNDVRQSELANDIMIDIYVDHLKSTGSMKKKSIKHIRHWVEEQIDSKEDVYFNAKESVELGFADYIFEGDYINLNCG